MKYWGLKIGIVSVMFFSIAYVSFATEKVIALTFDDGSHATYFTTNFRCA